jgi:hypothetical protein
MPAITDFIGLMNRQHGFARSARYEVVLYPPKGINLPDHITRDVSLQCDTIVMPGHDLNTHSAKYGTAVETQMVSGHKFEGTIAATFYLDTNFEVQSYFNLWQHAAVNRETNKVSYYKDYAGSMEIYQLGSDYSANETRHSPFTGQNYTGKYTGKMEGPRNSYKEQNTRQVNQMVTKRTYGMLVEEVYPETIGQIEYAYATVDTIALLPVEFQYRKWRTLDPTELDNVERKFQQ